MVTCTHITSGHDNDANSTTTITAVPFVSGRVYLLGVENAMSGSVTPNTPTASSTSFAFSAIDNINFDTQGGSRRKISLLAVYATSTVTEDVTIDFAAQNQAQDSYVLNEIAGADVSSGITSAIVQHNSAKAADNYAVEQDDNLTVPLAAFGNVNNATWDTFANWGGDPMILEGGYTEVSRDAVIDIIISGFLASNDTTPSMTTGSVGENLGGIAIELKAAAVAGGPVSPFPSHLQV
jgi:hypothetical protein